MFNHFERKIQVVRKNLSALETGKVFEGIKLAQISDLHINKWNITLIEESVDMINSLKTDVIVITGDIICNGKKYIPDLINFFKRLKAKYGKYSCHGNHDRSDGDDGSRMINAYKKSEFQILINNSDKLKINNEIIYIAGADDYTSGSQNLKKMTKNIEPDKKSIFLTHNPINFKEISKYNPALVLAGHTHGCQLSCSIMNPLYKKILGCEYISGLYKHEKSLLYVNRGIGASIFSPVIFNKKFYIKTPRINSMPEITLFTIK